MRKNEESIKPGDVVRITRPGDALCGMCAEIVEILDDGSARVKGGIVGETGDCSVFDVTLPRQYVQKEPSLTERLKKRLSRHE